MRLSFLVFQQQWFPEQECGTCLYMRNPWNSKKYKMRNPDICHTITNNVDYRYYHWLLSMQYLERSKDNYQLISKYHENASLADLYYAYNNVFLYLVRFYIIYPFILYKHSIKY